jgi:hypothetical protein
MFKRQERRDQYGCQFESMWGYAMPCRTFGFFDAHTDDPARGGASAWIGETNAGVIFDIAPTHSAYQLIVDVQSIAAPSTAFAITLNGVALSADWQSQNRITSTFPGGLLKTASNVLAFHSTLDQRLGLSMSIKNIIVIPAANQGGRSPSH